MYLNGYIKYSYIYMCIGKNIAHAYIKQSNKILDHAFTNIFEYSFDPFTSINY